MMKQMSKKIAILVLALVGFTAYTNAQNSQIETVALKFEQDTMIHEDFVEAITAINKAKDNDKTGNWAKMWYWRGRLYLALHRSGDEALKKEVGDPLDIALESFMKVKDGEKADRYSDDAYPWIIQTGLDLYREAYTAQNNKEYKEALRRYQEILKVIPYDKTGDLKRSANITPETMYQYSYYMAMYAQDYPLAIKYIKELIDRSYADPRIYIDIANLYMSEKDTASALKYLKMGKDLFEGNIDLINTELDIFLKMGKTAELIEQSNQAIEQDPTNKLYYFVRGVSYDKLGETDKAIADYEKAIELDPYYYDAYYNLGATYINQTEDVINKIQESQDQDEINKLSKKVDELYIKALPYFESALENVEADNINEKIALGTTMKQLYAKLAANYPEYMDKYRGIKKQIEGWESQK